jgi:hypothetical protein
MYIQTRTQANTEYTQTRITIGRLLTQSMHLQKEQQSKSWAEMPEAAKSIELVKFIFQTNGESACDTRDAMNSQERYLAALAKYESSCNHWQNSVPKLANLPHMQRGVEAVEFDSLLFGFRHRVPELGKLCPRELDIWQSAVCLPWRLWPDSMTGHLMVLNYLAENFVTTDLQFLNMECVGVIKQISQNSRWQNNPACGAMTSNTAKTILARISRGCSFTEATTIPIERIFDGPNQPKRSTKKAIRAGVGHWGTSADLRQVCGNSGCTQVESTINFKKCSSCKNVSYCSKDCQKKAWKNGHKQACNDCRPSTAEHVISVVPTRTPSNSDTALNFATAAGCGHVDDLKSMLLNGPDVNIVRNDTTALWAATMRGKLEAMELLIEARADLNWQDKMGSTALHAAAAKNNLAACQILLRAGASTSLADNDGDTAEETAWAVGSNTAGSFLHKR